jgi:hypothetical protein
MLTVAAVVLMAGHGLLYRAVSNLTFTAAIVVGMIVVIAIKHLGLLGLLYSRFRRR